MRLEVAEAFLRPPGYTWMLAAAALGLLATVSLLAFLVPVENSVVVDGRVYSSVGSVVLRAPISGVVTELDLRDGDLVKRDQVLFMVSSETGGSLSGQTSEAKANALAETIEALSTEMSSIDRLIGIVEQKVELERSRIEESAKELDSRIEMQLMRSVAAEDLLSRLESLEAHGGVSKIALAQQRDVAIGLRSELARLRGERSAGSSGLLAFELTAREEVEQLHLRRSELKRSLSTARSQLKEQEMEGVQAFRSPTDAIVGVAKRIQGETVQAGEPIMELLPLGGELTARLDIPGEVASSMSRGMPVSIEIQFPAVGVSQEIAGEVVSLTALPENVSEAGDSRYRAIIGLHPEELGALSMTLRPGMPVSASIALESMSLAKWVSAR